MEYEARAAMYPRGQGALAEESRDGEIAQPDVEAHHQQKVEPNHGVFPWAGHRFARRLTIGPDLVFVNSRGAPRGVARTVHGQ
jgi:hypothetical protein